MVDVLRHDNKCTYSIHRNVELDPKPIQIWKQKNNQIKQIRNIGIKMKEIDETMILETKNSKILFYFRLEQNRRRGQQNLRALRYISKK